MLYQIYKGNMSPVDKIVPADGYSYISVVTVSEALQYFPELIPRALAAQMFGNPSMRFENHEQFDLLCLPLFRSFRDLEHSPSIYIIIQKNSMHLVCGEHKNLVSLLEQFIKNNAGTAGIGRLLCAFFEYQLDDDLSELDNIEKQIADLEDRVLTDQQENFTKEIIRERKRLMAIMRYYEGLLGILEYAAMNEKHVFSSRSVRFLNIIHGKTQRLYDKAKTLREYVSEIREAYQAEVDIRTNNIMKILTIVTIIFMPLTLIVGWYGMNLRMPEYGFAAAYPIVIVSCILVAVLGIIYFKKHKWF
ncbi:magnesium transporter CorA family protein [Christensenella tenuis]|jgi:magnesium transporter|uniref:Magnesium transporter n=1 Tax=Christensenella tenuis TaxID=2763033 RepID=A0ABR7EE22_9FIRM|nr:CorA family divalent cation transporter [Christensenella tenuis]MBC5648026.1 hypothetical protein [Christensenella tenuis]